MWQQKAMREQLHLCSPGLTLKTKLWDKVMARSARRISLKIESATLPMLWFSGRGSKCSRFHTAFIFKNVSRRSGEVLELCFSRLNCTYTSIQWRILSLPVRSSLISLPSLTIGLANELILKRRLMQSLTSTNSAESAYFDWSTKRIARPPGTQTKA